jgi:hydroxymethylpyrimidine pyrophosphatase-like HAD family hydrolase
MKVAFDIDDTLIIPSVVTGDRDVPNYDTIAILRWFQAQGHEIVLWSGSGMEWAQTWGEKLGLQPFIVRMKGETLVDIAFDDCDVKLGTVNVKVKRLDNHISRKEWNASPKPNDSEDITP